MAQIRKEQTTSYLHLYCNLMFTNSDISIPGAVPNVQRAALVNMGDLAAYDYSKQFLMREFGMADTLGLHAASAFAAGFVAAVLGTPADVLKTRLMNQPIGPDGR